MESTREKRKAESLGEERIVKALDRRGESQIGIGYELIAKIT